MDKKQLGKLGESYAESFLVSQNYRILAKNFSCRYGEIDLIAISGQGELCFVEVKTRRFLKFGQLTETVSRQKLQKIIRTALHFLAESKQFLSAIWRVDLIAVKFNRFNKFQSLTHLKDITNG